MQYASITLRNQNGQNQFHTCTLVKREMMTSDTCLIVLESNEVLASYDVSPGYHVSIRAHGATRSYTPVPETLQGMKNIRSNLYQVCLLVKAVPQGKISSYLHSSPIGTTMEILSPIVGTFRLQRGLYSELVLISGGSGISTILSILKAARDGMYKIQQIHVYAFSSTGIPYENELNQLANDGYIKLTCSEGRACLSDFSNLPSPNYGVGFALCGPVPFMDTCIQFLSTLKHRRNNIHAFGLDDR